MWIAITWYKDGEEEEEEEEKEEEEVNQEVFQFHPEALQRRNKFYTELASKLPWISFEMFFFLTEI